MQVVVRAWASVVALQASFSLHPRYVTSCLFGTFVPSWNFMLALKFCLSNSHYVLFKCSPYLALPSSIACNSLVRALGMGILGIFESALGTILGPSESQCRRKGVIGSLFAGSGTFVDLEIGC